MITKVKCGFDGPKRGRFYPMDDISEGMITGKQRHTLTDLIFQNFEDEDERESWLAQINDITSGEANQMIFEFLSAKW